MKTKLSFVLVILLGLPLAGLSADKPDLTLPFLMLSTMKTGTMEKELKQAADAGYRIVVGSPSSSEMMLILEKMPESAGIYEYILLATSKTSTMQKEVSAAATQGYRLRPSTMMMKKQANPFALRDFEIVMVMEKAPNGQDQYDYLLLATSNTGTLQKEIAQAVRDGFDLVGLVHTNENIAIMERKAH